MNMHRVLQAVLILAAALQQPASAITSPASGQTLPAQVTIRGTIDHAVFSYAELAFGYSFDPTDTWFLIQVISQPPEDDVLATWDTSGLTDGVYRLRLRVHAPDGSFQDALVNDLHVVSEPLPTATPIVTVAALMNTPESMTIVVPAATEPSLLPLEATSMPVLSTPLPLPPNQAALTAASVYSILGRGALLALILFFVLGIFLRLRRP